MENFDEQLRANIRSLLRISDDTIDGVIQAVKYAGVESFSDLEFVQEEDLTMVLKPVQRRKLIKAWSKPDMRYVAAYHLAALGGHKNPSVADIGKILGGVGIEFDQERAKKVISELNAKNANKVTASADPPYGSLISLPDAPDTVSHSISPLPEMQNNHSSLNSKPSEASLLSSSDAPGTVSHSHSPTSEVQSNNSSISSKPSCAPLLPLPDAPSNVSRSRSPSPDLQSNHSSLSSKLARGPLLPLPDSSGSHSRSRSPSPVLQRNHSSLNSKHSRTPLLPPPESQNSHYMPHRGPLLRDPRCPSPPFELENNHSSLNYVSPRYTLLPNPDDSSYAVDALSPSPALLRNPYESSPDFMPASLLPLPSTPAGFPPAKSRSKITSTKRKRDEAMQAY